ncbi:hypothetical protein FBUS_02055 [Fasciolopsis buskii]|uniref:Uncharacterized protein n=1 Tax=Fasciolopsis buskii TaxID=27845 RepID=A0A8E0RKC8_9TREM|nr:hypothetical protein FBUS_02055 [Fasciolopsis buski]
MESNESDFDSNISLALYCDQLAVGSDDDVNLSEELTSENGQQSYEKRKQSQSGGDPRRTELNAHTTGRNCCLEWAFRRTLHRFYAGYKQAMNRIDREQGDVSMHLLCELYAHSRRRLLRVLSLHIGRVY